MQVQQRRPIREHRINIHILNIGQVRNRILRQIQIVLVLYGAVVLIDPVEGASRLVEVVPGLPLELGVDAHRQQTNENRH